MTAETLMPPDALYERDFYLWTQAQAAALRAAAAAGANLPVDWENVAEEIESLGRSDVREVRSRLAVILVHLLKLTHSVAGDPRRGWRQEITAARRALERVLDDSPSLRQRVPELIVREWPRAVQDARAALLEYREPMPEDVGPAWAVERVVGSGGRAIRANDGDCFGGVAIFPNHSVLDPLEPRGVRRWHCEPG